MYSVLRPGGVLFINVVARYYIYLNFNYYQRMIQYIMYGIGHNQNLLSYATD